MTKGKNFIARFTKFDDRNAFEVIFRWADKARVLAFCFPKVATNDETNEISLWRISLEKVKYIQFFSLYHCKSMEYDKTGYLELILGPVATRIGWSFGDRIDNTDKSD